MKKLFKVFVATMVAVVTVCSVYAGRKKEVLSDLALSNVEALAWPPEGRSCFRLFPCPYSPGNECIMKQDANRPECYAISYCSR